MKKKIKSDEIDLIEVLICIWNNKLKIASITAIFIVLSVTLHFIFKPTIIAKTKILPINIFENDLYLSYNSLINDQPKNDNQENLYKIRLNRIEKTYLLNLFLEELETKEVIKESIKNYQLINPKKFDTEEKYIEAVEKKSLKLNLLRPVNVDSSKKGETRLNWIIEFEINDKVKWEESLSFIENKINSNIQEYLKKIFNIRIDNLKLTKQFELEDLNLKIKNVKNDYVKETSNRLAFLREQSLIARKLNIENNTLEVENFSIPSGVISNLQTAKPYYMRGYSMIEKEIELIETRTNKDAFTNNLLDLEKQRRALLEDKSLQRIEKLFYATPIFTLNDFKAANIVYKNTEYKTSHSLIQVILLAGIFGIIFGMSYVLFRVAVKQRK